MSHQVNVYYKYCMKKATYTGDYHNYQRELADKILDVGLKDMFQIDGTGKVIERTTYGKPYLKGQKQYHFNISNTDGMVICGISDVEIGVDTEKEKPFRKGILKKCATSLERKYILDGQETEQESHFFQLWTLKESYVKMTGEGLRIPLQEVEFKFEREEESERTKIICSKAGNFYQYQENGYWISLCAKEKVKVRWIPCV